MSNARPRVVKDEPDTDKSDGMPIDDERIQGIIDGTIESPSEVVTYFVNQAKALQMEARKGIMESKKHEMLSKQLHAEAMDAQAQVKKYLDDIREWDKKAKE